MQKPAISSSQSDSISPYDSLSWSEKVGVNLRLARESRNLTLEEVAAKIPVDPSTLSRWESGKRSPRIHIIETIGRVLEMNPKDLLP